MKTLKIFILAAFAAAFTSACQTVDVTPEPSSEKVLMTFSVTADNSDETRTFLASNGQSVRWKNTDELAVWDGTQVCKFSIPETVKDFSGAVDFTGHARDGQEAYYALYPYAAEGLTFTTSDGDPYVTGVTFPEVQTATKGSYDPKAVVSVAVSEDKNFEMRNTVALAKVTINSAYIKSVQITAADNETNAKAYLAAVSKVMIKEYPAVYAQSSQSKSVTLTSETAMEPGDYYIAMIPRTLEGLSVTYTKTDGSVATVSSAATVEFKRATITPLGIDDSKLTFIKEEEPEEPETLTLTIDFTVGRDKVFTGYIPNQNTSSEKEFTFKQDDKEYKFNISSSKSFKYTDSSLMLNVTGDSDGSISLPAISGMKLSTVKIECAEVTAKTPIYVYSEKGLAGTKMEAVNMNENTSAKTLTLSDNTEEGTIPQLNTSYYFAVKAKAFKLKKLIITYTE